jgi:hypothetical protein
MRYRSLTGALALAAMLSLSIDGAQAFDETKFPDWKGQWVQPSIVSKRRRLGMPHRRRKR